MLPVMSIFIPVVLTVLLGPGVGQLYNKEFRKGLILIGLSLVLLIAFSFWLSKAALAYLPPDITKVNPTMLRNIIQNHIVPEHSVTFYTYEALLAGLWLYGVIDAYIGASRVRAQKLSSSSSSSH